MGAEDPDQLWREFPKTLLEFERRFPTEAACREYLIAVRWGARPWCSRCGGERLSAISRHRLHCLDCHHQTTVTAGTIMEKTRKPLRLWFRALWEVCVHRPGISAKDLQRVLGLGSYETAWCWLHKLRRLMVDPKRTPLAKAIQLDEGFVRGARQAEGGTRRGKAVVLVAAEAGGRVRLAHAPSNDEPSLRRFADACLGPHAALTSDGLASYNARSLGRRSHRMAVQSPTERQQADALQIAHYAIAHLKRWWLGTHHGAISAKHLQAYLDEFAFRYNRRKTRGVGRLVARALQNIAHYPPLTMKRLVHESAPCRLFQNPLVELSG